MVGNRLDGSKYPDSILPEWDLLPPHQRTSGAVSCEQSARLSVGVNWYRNSNYNGQLGILYSTYLSV